MHTTFCLGLISIVPMVKGNTILIVLNWPIDAGCACERLLHHWLRTGATSKVRIPADGGEMGRTSSKVMIGDRVERRATIASNGSPHLIVSMTRDRTRVERRCTRQGTLARKISVFIVSVRLPVDGLHAALKVRGGSELPLADDGPHDDRGSDSRSDDDKDHHGRM